MKKTIFAIMCVIILGITTYSALATNFNANLIHYYAFDGNMEDNVSNVDGSVIGGGISSVSAKHNQGYDFSSAGAIQFASSGWLNIETTDEVTSCQWVNFDSISGYGAIISKSNGNGIELANQADNKLTFYLYDGLSGNSYVQTPDFLRTGQWYFTCLVGSVPQNMMSIYVNGTLMANGTYGGKTQINMQSGLKGMVGARDYGGYQEPIDAKIDEVSIFNKSLTASQISELYNSSNGMFYPFQTPPPTISWNLLPEYNNSIHNHDLIMRFDLTTETLADCSMYFDNGVTDTINNIPTGTYELNYTSNMSETGNHLLYIECIDDVATVQSSVKTIGFDYLNPTINLYLPIANNTRQYRIGGFNYNLLFSNVQLDSVNVTFLQGGIVVNETGNIDVNQPNYNLTETVSDNDIAVGNIDMIAWANHTAGGDTVKGYTFYLMDCPELVEDWVAQYTLCNTSNQQILTYEDANSCGTFEDLPVGNNTVSACNYCTLTYSTTVGDCITNGTYGTGTRTTSYDYTNYGSCCALTGLPEDCNLPANTTASCSSIGIHSSNEISGAVIDFGVEYGIFMVTMVGVIVIVGLGIYFRRLLK